MENLFNVQPPTLLSITFFIAVILQACSSNQTEEKENWTFVSMPDFLNVDCDYPQKGWEDALFYVLQSVKDENPDFLLVAGDLVMGHWDAPEWNDANTIQKYANRYYSAWKNRMKQHGLKYYTAIGDHEVGDNPWNTDKKLAAVKIYKQAFANHLNMPQNGPDHMKGTAFWWRHKGVLFISVDVFEHGESDQGMIKAGVTGEQLEWCKEILENNADAAHKIVMGHTPILSPVRQWSSSGLTIAEGADSEFWQLMKAHGVDAYLCGEVHAITCTERDGIMQVAHGGLIGYNTRTNYLVVKVSKDKLELTLKEIEMLPQGDHLWQTKNNRPLEKVTISEANRNDGFYPVGRVTIDKSTTKKFTNREGLFLKKYEAMSERAYPIFRKDNQQNIPTEVTKVVVGEE